VGNVGGGPGLDFVLAMWSRRKWLAIAGFCVPLTAAASVIMCLPNVYRSTATVVVERQQIPETFVRSTVTSALETRLHTISQDILSRSRLEELIDRFGLYADLRTRVPFEEVVGRMRSDIKLDLKSVEARGQREATVAFTISYQGSDPGTVAIIANTLASFYIEGNLKTRERQATSTADFLKVQLGDTKRRLDAQEQRVSEFKRRHLGELPQQMETNLGTLDRLHAQLRVNSDNQMRASERRQSLSSQLAEAEAVLSASPSAPTVLGMPAAQPESRQTRLTRLKEELTRLRTQFSEKYPDVMRLTAEIAAVELEPQDTKPADEKRDDKRDDKPAPSQHALLLTPYVLRLKEALAEVETDLKVLKSEETRLRDGIAGYQARVENVPRREQEFRELSRDYDSTRELYQSLLKRSEEALLAESMEQRQKGEQFRVVDPALPNFDAAAPNRLRLLAMTLAASVGLGVALVVGAEQLDSSFHVVDDLRTFSTVPVVVSIPLIVTRADLRKRRWHTRLGLCAGIVLLVVIVGIGYFAAHGNERLVSLLGRAG